MWNEWIPICRLWTSATAFLFTFLLKRFSTDFFLFFGCGLYEPNFVRESLYENFIFTFWSAAFWWVFKQRVLQVERVLRDGSVLCLKRKPGVEFFTSASNSNSFCLKLMLEKLKFSDVFLRDSKLLGQICSNNSFLPLYLLCFSTFLKPSFDRESRWWRI